MLKPESLKGSYRPVCLGEPLKYFVNHAQLNIYHNNSIINIMDFFPRLKQGYALKNTLMLLMYSYSHFNKLRQNQYIKVDQLIKDAFDSSIPALYYFVDGKILMTEALNSGIINKLLNTFDVVKLKYDGFSKSSFQSYFFHVIIGINIVSNGNFIDQNIINDLIYEYYLIDELCNISKEKPINLIHMISIATSKKYIMFVDYLIDKYITKEYVQLINSVVLNDVKEIEYLLTIVDPRDYDHGVYHLTNNRLILQNILERNWHEQQVFEKNINDLHGPSILPKTLLTYTRLQLI